MWPFVEYVYSNNEGTLRNVHTMFTRSWQRGHPEWLEIVGTNVWNHFSREYRRCDSSSPWCELEYLIFQNRPSNSWACWWMTNRWRSMLKSLELYISSSALSRTRVFYRFSLDRASFESEARWWDWCRAFYTVGFWITSLWQSWGCLRNEIS